jgi:hydrogenase maturation protease
MAAPHRAVPRILVAGLGNLLLQDEGVGVHAARELAKWLPRGVAVVDVGIDIRGAIGLLEQADKVLALDAVQAGGRPGQVYSFRLGDANAMTSVHGGGLRSAMDSLTGRRPEVVVLGIEPGRTGYGMELSPGVARAVPGLVARATTIIDRWQTDPPG